MSVPSPKRDLSPEAHYSKAFHISLIAMKEGAMASVHDTPGHQATTPAFFFRKKDFKAG